MAQTDQVEGQMEAVLSAVADEIKKLINQYRDLQQGCREKIEPFDEELFGFCDELESMRRMILDDSESLTVRVNCVGDVIDFINDSFKDVHHYLDTLESSVGIKRENIIDDAEWHSLKKPNVQFFQDKKAELDRLMSSNPELAAPELQVISSWQNIILKPDGAPALAFVMASVIYLILRLWNVNHDGYVTYAYAAVAVICVVAFLTWISQANDNLRQEKITGLEFTPSWCMWSFFVPVLGLYWPYQAMVEIWKASSVAKGDWKASPTPFFLPIWWLSFLAAKCLQIILLAALLANMDLYTHLFNASIVLDVIATLLAMMIVLMITSRQMKEFKRLS